MTRTGQTTANLVADYSARFSARYLHDHSVGSGLGVWLLLALLAPATDGVDRQRLEAVLGSDAEDACRRATELLADPHPAVAAAVALWSRPEVLIDAFGPWASSLPPTLDQGPMPDQAHADAWAHRNTLGLIRDFPARIDETTALVLASALATKVSWTTPLRPVPASELGGTFGTTITTAMRASASHRQMLAHTDAAGTVAVHAVDATSGLRAISVIGSPEVPAAELHLACHQVASLLQFGASEAAHELDLFDLPLGVGHAWTITEVEVPSTSGAVPTQVVESVLGAWTALGQHHLRDAQGVHEAGRTLGVFLRADGPSTFDALQTVLAEFTMTGFRAAALTRMMVAAGGPPPPSSARVRHRTARVRFNRPYAVLAVALDEHAEPSGGPATAPLGLPAWAGVPVFSAWVGRVDDAPAQDVPRRSRRSGGVEG